MKKNFFVLISVLFLFFSFNGYAQKTEEISLFEIDRLIKDTEYDKALQLLNSYLKKHPENFDNVQVRIKKIMNARKQYSALAEQLLWIIENEPENSQKIYEITEQLEQFEKNPSNQIKNFIQDAKKSSEFNYFRSLLQNENFIILLFQKLKKDSGFTKMSFMQNGIIIPKSLSRWKV